MDPQGPRNVGAVARVLCNFGLADLRIVSARGDELTRDEEAIATAMAGKGVLRRARICGSLEEARSGLDALVGATKRPGRHRAPIIAPWDLAATVLGSRRRYGFVLGNEVRGLTREQLAACEVLVRIPAIAPHDSLNLAQAACVLAYELRRAAAAGGGGGHAPTRAIDDLLAHVERTLTSGGFLAAGDPLHAMGKIRRYLLRHPPTEREVGLAHAVLQHWDRKSEAGG